MRKSALALTLFLLISFFSAAQETKPAPKTAYHPVPIKAAREPNPVNPTPESIAEGKKFYGYDCAQCHGATGDGKTDAARDLKIPDLTNPAVLKTKPTANSSISSRTATAPCRKKAIASSPSNSGTWSTTSDRWRKSRLLPNRSRPTRPGQRKGSDQLSRNSLICAQYFRTIKSVLRCPPRRNNLNLTPVS